MVDYLVPMESGDCQQDLNFELAFNLGQAGTYILSKGKRPGS